MNLFGTKERIIDVEGTVVQEEFPGSIVLSNAAVGVRCAVIVVCDTSGSMEGEPITSLNNGVKDMLDMLLQDDLARSNVDFAMVQFNDNAQPIQEFTPVTKVKPISLRAGGCTAMGKGVELALDMADEMRRNYDRMGIPAYKPMVFVISDGAPTDNITSAIKRAKELENRKKVELYCLGVPGCDMKTLKRLTERCIYLENVEFQKIFNWIGKSIIIRSSSAPGEKPQLPILPDNARIIPNEWY